jgi:hypothetical protein
MRAEHLPKNSLLSSARLPNDLPPLTKEKTSAFEDINIDDNELVLMTEEVK